VSAQNYNYVVHLRLREQPKQWIVVASGAVCAQGLLSLLWHRSFRLTAFGDLIQCVLLLSCVLSIFPSVARERGRIRLFWALMGTGFGTWLCAQMLWTYFEVFLHREVPNPFIGDVILFLHIVPMMAALALQPHVRRDDPLAKQGSLDFVLLLIWWLYLFLFVVIPWQYVYPSEVIYGRSFDVLYLSEHLVFLSALVLVWRRSTGSWRIVYTSLLGAATLYAISSIAASIAIDLHVYYTGSLYDLPLLAAIAWFSGVGAIAPRTLSQEGQPTTAAPSKPDIWAARLAMAAVFSTPFMIAWAVFGGHGPLRVRTYRLVLTVSTMLVMGGLVFLKQHLLDQELIRLLRVSQENLGEASRLRDDLVHKEKTLLWFSRELQRKNLELQEVSFTDSLTGLWNRRYLEEALPGDAGLILRERGRAHETATEAVDRRDLVFLMVDIDSFKKVNDSYGHAVGDVLLQKIAKRLSSVVRKSDLLVRWGGEEFLIMTRSSDRSGIPAFCDRILAVMASERFELSNNISLRKTCSIGWAPYPWCATAVDAICPEDVIELADTALYLAKAEGRNQSVGFLPGDLAMTSPERITPANLRDGQSGLIRVVKAPGGDRDECGERRPESSVAEST
jgi:diguanylate cyclase (GGDEF)-like protein